MLELKKITKIYETEGLKTAALSKVSINFRESEFVSILGPSGSGKTTLLNIIGGLDNYDSGEMIINEVSTKDYKDKDWDAYRNHRIGFVFQNYNLISHQSVLQNVELALTLSGVSKRERRKRAKQALREVGLEKHMNKRPNQLSGGQMQRVAIARALINDPDIVLADEPTGALDTATSEQIMKLLKEVAKTKLVIMVTHNPDLAKEYSTRIVKIRDGKVEKDSKPYNGKVNTKNVAETEAKKTAKTSMSMRTALGLSKNNLMTKKGRTFLTAFAGSIGIIGIALILSLSNGIQMFIDKTEKETLGSYPLSIAKESVDFSSFISSLVGKSYENNYDDDLIHSSNIMADVFETMSTKVTVNNVKALKDYFEGEGKEKIEKLANNVSYGYKIDLNLYKADGTQVNPSTVLDTIGMGRSGVSSVYSTMMAEYDVFTELDNMELTKSMANLVAGEWPDEYNELVLLLDGDGMVSDYTLYSLGIISQEDLKEQFENLTTGKDVEFTEHAYTKDELLNLEFKLVLPTDYYKKSGNMWMDMRDDDAFMANVISKAPTLKIVGIAQPDGNIMSSNNMGLVGYPSSLMEYMVGKINESEIAKEQRANPSVNVLTGKKFGVAEAFSTDGLSPEQMMYLSTLSTSELAQLVSSYQENASATYESILKKLGIAEMDDPDFIYLYPNDFEAKEKIKDLIEEYNEGKDEADKISYSDAVGVMTNSISTIVDVISAVLIAFVAVSLIVSSIMIAIITYISVLERTKEIGILRAIGASKRDISHVFNAETIIEGFVAGVFGVVFTALLNIPINIIIKHVTGFDNIASLPIVGAVVLVIISIFLTFIAGLIPSRIASKKDPVDALRTE